MAVYPSGPDFLFQRVISLVSYVFVILNLDSKLTFPAEEFLSMASQWNNQTFEVEARLKLVAPTHNFYLTKGSISIRRKVSEST